MGVVENIAGLTPDEIEDVEKLTSRWLFRAAFDFGFDAYDIFLNSPDDVQDVAEDVTRELLDRLPGYNTPQRVFGNVDYKKARYIVLPDRVIRQALFVDSKAEKDDRSATIQMSQTSMVIKQVRGGAVIERAGLLPAVAEYGGQEYLTTTALLHYCYQEIEGRRQLQGLTLSCIPNGRLQQRYNPDAERTFWIAGRNAPTRGEVFRARLSFHRLSRMCAWRVQRVNYDAISRTCFGSWSE